MTFKNFNLNTLITLTLSLVVIALTFVISSLVGEIQTLQTSITTLQHQNAELLDMLADMRAKMDNFEEKQQPLDYATFNTQKTILGGLVGIGIILALLYSNRIDPGTLNQAVDQIMELVNDHNGIMAKILYNFV